MEIPNLQSGDEVTLKRRTLVLVGIARHGVMNVRHKHNPDATFEMPWLDICQMLKQGAEVHRPTHAGLVQVWPEEEER